MNTRESTHIATLHFHLSNREAEIYRHLAVVFLRRLFSAPWRLVYKKPELQILYLGQHCHLMMDRGGLHRVTDRS